MNSYKRNGSPLGDPRGLPSTNLVEPISELISRGDVLGEIVALLLRIGSLP